MRRRVLLGGAAAAVLAPIIPDPALALDCGLAVPPSGPTFRDLPETRSKDGRLETELRMALKQVTVGGIAMTMAAYNDDFPGRIYRLKPGDRLRWNLKNRLKPAGVPKNPPVEGFDPASLTITNVHTHGLQVDPGPGGDDVITPVAAGEDKCYTYDIPGPETGIPQPAGLHWYHPHKHGATSHQGWQGLAGPFIIEGDIDRVPEVAAARERVLLINELLFDETGATPSAVMLPSTGFSPFTADPAVPTDIRFPVNGVLTPDIDIAPGQTQRWRVLAAGPHRFFDLQIDGHELWQIGQDGIPFARARRMDRILLAPGNRAEFILKGGAPGRYGVRALCYDQGHPGGPRPEKLLATLAVAGAPQDGRLPDALVRPPAIPPDAPHGTDRTLVFSGDISGKPVKFYIDGKQFDATRTDQTVKVGTWEDLTLVNKDVFQHPFHIHVNPFMVIEQNGVAVADPVWWDTIRLPSRGSVKVRMYFRPDVTGLTVYHCHILPHEDNGMMGTILLSKTGDPAERDNPADPVSPASCPV